MVEQVTEQTPEPEAWPTPGQHYGDLVLEPQRDVKRWDTTLEGPGRWVALEVPQGSPVGLLWTDGRDRLGFLPVTPQRNPQAPAFTQTIGDALRGARYAGARAADVFAWWAQRDGQSMAAGNVVEGDLETLQPLA